MLTVNPTLAKPERGLPSGLSIHGRLAVAITFPAEADAIALWQAVMPTQSDFRDSLPVCWPLTLQENLPAAARKLLQKQRDKLENDARILLEAWLPSYAAVTGEDVQQLVDRYHHGWLLVNTRCFYWDYPVFSTDGLYGKVHGNTKKGARTSKARKWPRDDCMTLNPVVDYFNHADTEGVSLPGPTYKTLVWDWAPLTRVSVMLSTMTKGSLSRQIATMVSFGYCFQPNVLGADNCADEGEEVTISYGKHSNDFLLVECTSINLLALLSTDK